MSNNKAGQSMDIVFEQERLTKLVETIVSEAKNEGASQCEVGASSDQGLSTTVRFGDVETIEFNKDIGFGITAYFGHRKGTASTTDSSKEAIKATVKAACDIARYTSEDPFSGLAEKSLMAKQFPDLDLYHPWEITPDQAVVLAKKCEDAGRATSELITNTEGATVNTHQSCRVYANSHGFIGSKTSSYHSVSCSFIAQKGDDMQRDYWYTVARDSSNLENVEHVGEIAAKRTINRLGATKLKTGKIPVIYSAELASGLLHNLISAISGGSIYRQSSFLLNSIDKQIFPEWVRIHEIPQLKHGMGSGSFDGDGLQTYSKDFVSQGILKQYVLGTYSARKLKLKSSANADGVRNLFIDSNAGNQDSLIKQMNKGLLITELVGHGANIVTGDYSRGAAGYWIENGQIQYPISEITIAGNLKDMFHKFIAVGDDVDTRGNVQTGSILVDGLVVGGN